MRRFKGICRKTKKILKEVVYYEGTMNKMITTNNHFYENSLCLKDTYVLQL